MTELMDVLLLSLLMILTTISTHSVIVKCVDFKVKEDA